MDKMKINESYLLNWGYEIKLLLLKTNVAWEKAYREIFPVHNIFYY